jgi:hypothetical protein
MKLFFSNLFFISIIAIPLAMFCSFVVWFCSYLASVFLGKDTCINPLWMFLIFYICFLFFLFIWKSFCDASQGGSPAIISKIFSFLKEKLIDTKNWYIENNIPSNTFIVINVFNLLLYYFFIGSFIWLIVIFLLSIVAFLFVKILVIKKDEEEN